MVRARIEDPEILNKRREICQSKSVSELSKIEGMADFPIPTTIEKLIQSRIGQNGGGPPEINLEKLTTENIYATLPRSLKSEVLVRTRVENPEVLENRRNIVQSKSVSELAQVNTLADFPLPTPIEHLIQGKSALRLPKPEL